jgi:hypothetical protein
VALAPTGGNSASHLQRTAFAFARPGGISLSEAAAAAMPIDLDLDGVHYRDGKLIISGRKNPTQILDAALVLTALRASCEPGDPYFSLDPDNGLAWSIEGHSASERLWERVSKELGWGTAVKADQKTVKSSSLFVRTIWARRDYPQLWNTIASDYPNLKSRLVFRPAWLQETRFGEILYKADVLLKELSSGMSVLEPGALRADKIDSYVSELSRSNARTLFAGLRDETVLSQWRGSRLWFDIAPRQSNANAIPDPLIIRSAADRQLFNVLKERRLVAASPSTPRLEYQVIKEGNTLDLSRVFPTMFVRRRDIAKGLDLPDDDPIMNSLSTDVNDNIEKYAGAYKELQALTEIVRAYIAAVHVVRNNGSICQRIRGMPLLDSEKATYSLPTHHPSELMISMERYAVGTGRAVRTLSAKATLLQGGVAIAGKQFYEASAVSLQTPVIASLKSELAIIPSTDAIKPLWADASGRQFMVLNLRDDQEPGRKPQESLLPGPAVSPGKIPSEVVIENEPPPQPLPPSRTKWFEKRN